MVELVGFHLYLEELKAICSKTCHLEILCRVAVGDIAYCWLCSSAHPSSKKKKKNQNHVLSSCEDKILWFSFSHNEFLLKPKS